MKFFVRYYMLELKFIPIVPIRVNRILMNLSLMMMMIERHKVRNTPINTWLIRIVCLVLVSDRRFKCKYHNLQPHIDVRRESPGSPSCRDLRDTRRGFAPFTFSTSSGNMGLVYQTDSPRCIFLLLAMILSLWMSISFNFDCGFDMKFMFFQLHEQLLFFKIAINRVCQISYNRKK